MKIKKVIVLFVVLFAFGTIGAGHAAAQNSLTLNAVGNGEKARLKLGGKTKTVMLVGFILSVLPLAVGLLLYVSG